MNKGESDMGFVLWASICAVLLAIIAWNYYQQHRPQRLVCVGDYCISLETK